MHYLQRFKFTYGPVSEYLLDIGPHTGEPVLDVLKMMPNIDRLELSLIFGVGEGIVLGFENNSMLCRNLRTSSIGIIQIILKRSQ